MHKRRIEAYDLSNNEMAKVHIRHLVGGHAPSAKNEILYRFEFPERPGALMQFLNSMSRGWNISLFHYRNHGADYGRVLVGMQVPPPDKASKRRQIRPIACFLGAEGAQLRQIVPLIRESLVANPSTGRSFPVLARIML
jgi:hypothetical protein